VSTSIIKPTHTVSYFMWWCAIRIRKTDVYIVN